MILEVYPGLIPALSSTPPVSSYIISSSREPHLRATARYLLPDTSERPA